MVGEPAKNKISLKLFKIVFYALLILIIAFLLYVLLEGFFASLKASLGYINNSLVINSLINSSNTYLTLLQEIVISASMIFGFYAILLFYFVDHITKFIDTYTADIDTTFIKFFTLIFVLLPFFLIFLSAFYSITATIIYGTPNLTYSTIKTEVYSSIDMLLFGTSIIIVNLIVFLLVRLWLSALSKKYRVATILLFIWYALLLFILFLLLNMLKG